MENISLNYENDKKLSLLTESDLQKAVVRFLRTTDLLFTCSLGDTLDDPSKRCEAYIKGYCKGVADIIIFTPSGSFNSFFLELKTPAYGSGVLSKEQKEFLLTASKECNAYCMVSNDYTEIIYKITQYIHGCL